MLHISSKVCIWETFSIPDEYRDELLEFMKQNPYANGGAIFDWAISKGLEPHADLIEGTCEYCDTADNKETVLEIIDDEDTTWYIN